MFKKWIGAAVVAGWVGSAAIAPAQYLPSPVGAARIPDPAPVAGQCPPPNLTPGPMTSQMAPPGPPPELALPASHTSAFPCEEYPVKDHCYVHLGGLLLERQHLGHLVTAFFDASTTSALDTGAITRPPNFRPVQDADDIDPDLTWGFKATAGVLVEAHGVAFELSGFYVPERQFFTEGAAPGRLNTFFTNVPLGFEGNNDISLQADLIRSTFKSSLGGVEANLKWFNKGIAGCEPSIGVRYLDLYERFSILVDDDSISFRDPDFMTTDPTRRATFSWRTFNRIVAPQFGLDWQCELHQGIALGLNGKVAVGANFADARATATRGDGFVGLSSGRTRTNFAQVYEFGATLDVYCLDRFRIRAGYTTLFAVGVLEATDQVSFDLAPPSFNQGNDGTVFYHGPSFEFQFLF